MLVNPPSSESPLLYVLLIYTIIYAFIIYLSEKLLERQSKFIHDVKQGEIFEKLAVADLIFSFSFFTFVS